MTADVRQAFLDRPGLVDDAPGFLGMEVSVDRQDGFVFHLLTRWTDEASFERWHSSPSHAISHRGIPKGLKLDAAHTSVRKFEVFAGSQGQLSPDAASVLRFLPRARSLHWLRAALDGRILAANRAFEALLHEGKGGMAGQSLWSMVTEADADSLRAILRSCAPDAEAPDAEAVLLNFVDRDHVVCSLECYVERHAEEFVLLGEFPHHDDRALARELLELNNRWSLLVRENEKSARALRQTKEELEKALADLNESHWHLRKIQETLPICMYCGKVKTGEVHWEGVVEYLKANSLFLTHGCCPTCLNQHWPGME